MRERKKARRKSDSMPLSEIYVRVMNQNSPKERKKKEKKRSTNNTARVEATAAGRDGGELILAEHIIDNVNTTQLISFQRS